MFDQVKSREKYPGRAHSRFRGDGAFGIRSVAKGMFHGGVFMKRGERWFLRADSV